MPRGHPHSQSLMISLTYYYSKYVISEPLPLLQHRSGPYLLVALVFENLGGQRQSSQKHLNSYCYCHPLASMSDAHRVDSFTSRKNH